MNIIYTNTDFTFEYIDFERVHIGIAPFYHLGGGSEIGLGPFWFWNLVDLNQSGGDTQQKKRVFLRSRWKRTQSRIFLAFLMNNILVFYTCNNHFAGLARDLSVYIVWRNVRHIVNRKQRFLQSLTTHWLSIEIKCILSCLLEYNIITENVRYICMIETD